jgi:uncharacterized protein YceK
MKKTFFISALAISLLLPSCASIVSGSQQKIEFNSTPAGAIVWVDGANLGVTPITTKLERIKKNQKVKIELQGYKPYEMTLTRKTNGWVWGNIVFGGIIGLIIDASSGALYRLTPEQVNAQLANGVVMNKKNDTYIGVVLVADENWEKIGNIELK